MTPRQRAQKIAHLKEMIRTKSFLVKDKLFTLSSKSQSNAFFNMKPTMLDPEGGHLIAELMFDSVADNAPDFISGPAVGAVPLIYPFTRAAYERGVRVMGTYTDKPKDHGIADTPIQGLWAEQPDVKGKRGIVVEDVTTTGDSAFKAVEVLRNAGADIYMVIAILNRDEGAIELFQKNGLGYTALSHIDEFISAEQHIFYRAGSPESQAWLAAKKREEDEAKSRA